MLALSIDDYLQAFSPVGSGNTARPANEVSFDQGLATSRFYVVYGGDGLHKWKWNLEEFSKLAL